MNDAGAQASEADGAQRDFSITRHKGPYPGLRPYSVNERDLFCGRDAQIREIIQHLCTRRFAAILGGSGSGKSSLIRAGVIPELRLYAVPGRSDTWVPVIFNPEDAPIRRLAEALDAQLVKADSKEQHRQRLADIEAMLAGPAALERFLERYQDLLQIGGQSLAGFGKQASLLVVVDQFEEIFREQAVASKQVDPLVDLITEAYERKNERVYVVLTMRTESLDRCAGYLQLPSILNDVSYLTRRLNDQELEEVIVEPARRYFAEKWPDRDEIYDPDPWPFDPEVKDRLLEAVRSIATHTDHLPLLQHLLFWLWQAALTRWNGGGAGRFGITQRDLHAVVRAGKEMVANPREALDPVQASIMGRCLECNANKLYDQLSPQCQRIATDMFKRLAEVDERGVYTRLWTNRRAISQAAGATIEEVNQVLDALGRPHPYLRCDGRGEMDNIDVSHESFIRNWKRFRDCLEEDKEARKAYKDVLGQYLRWRDRRARANIFARLYIWYFDRLGNKTREKAAQFNLSDMASGWLVRHQADLNKSFKNVISEDDCRQAVKYYEHSRRVRWSDRALFLLGFLFIVGGGYYFLFVKESERLAKLEAKAYSAYSIAASAAQTRVDALDMSQNSARLWQTAVALNILGKLEQDKSWEAGEAALKFEAARRFALKTVDAAVRDISRSSIWEVKPDAGSLHDGAPPIIYKDGPGDDRRCMESLLERPAPEDRLYQGSSIRDGGRPLLAVHWQLSGDRMVTSLVLGIREEDGACRRLPTGEITIGSVRDLGVDLDLRLVVGIAGAINGAETATQTNARSFFVQRLRWLSFGARAELDERPEYRVLADTTRWFQVAGDGQPRFRFGAPDQTNTAICLQHDEQCYKTSSFDSIIELSDGSATTVSLKQNIICGQSYPDSGEFCLQEDRKAIKTKKLGNLVTIPESEKLVEIRDFSASNNGYLAYVYTGRKGDGLWANQIVVLKVPPDSLEGPRSVAVLQHPIVTFDFNGPPIDKIDLIEGRRPEKPSPFNEGEMEIYMKTGEMKTGEQIASGSGAGAQYYKASFGIPATMRQICDALGQNAGAKQHEKWLSPTFRLLQELEHFGENPCKPDG